MRLQINGKETTCSATTLTQLVKELGFKTESLIIEHNARIVKQQEWANTLLKEGDIVELLNFVGGG